MNAPRLQTREKWREIIGRQEASGLPVAAFCRREAVAASALYVWKRRLRGADTPPAFVEARLAASSSSGVHAGSGAVQVCLRGGRRVIVRPGFDRDLLAEVVSVMEGLS
jgi:hypothetical protein